MMMMMVVVVVMVIIIVVVDITVVVMTAAATATTAVATITAPAAAMLHTNITYCHKHVIMNSTTNCQKTTANIVLKIQKKNVLSYPHVITSGTP
jgi:hypothetical protein